MLISNWHVIMEAHVIKTSESARIFFFTYYVVANLIITNVIVSFILDAFVKVSPLLDLQQTKGEASVVWLLTSLQTQEHKNHTHTHTHTHTYTYTHTYTHTHTHNRPSGPGSTICLWASRE